jgi:hypothetical protein
MFASYDEISAPLFPFSPFALLEFVSDFGFRISDFTPPHPSTDSFALALFSGSSPSWLD